MNIDPRTVILLAGVMGGMMSVVLFVMRRNYPTVIVGLGEWASATGLIFVSTLLLGARGVIPDLFSVVGGNLFLLIGLALFHIGSQRFLATPPWTRTWTVLILSSLPMMLWFTLVEPHYGIRVLTMRPATCASRHWWCRPSPRRCASSPPSAPRPTATCSSCRRHKPISSPPMPSACWC
jgi:hypothetical protein